jgi:hypothetical protein
LGQIGLNPSVRDALAKLLLVELLGPSHDVRF